MNKYFVAFLCISSCAYAAEQSYVAQLRGLLKRRDTYDVTKIGKKEIDHKTQKRIERMVKKAQRSRENLNERDSGRCTMAHDLAQLALSGVRELEPTHTFLLESGVDFFAKDRLGQTPCDIVQDYRYRRWEAIEETEFPELDDQSKTDDPYNSDNSIVYDSDGFVVDELKLSCKRLAVQRLNKACYGFIKRCKDWQKLQEDLKDFRTPQEKLREQREREERLIMQHNLIAQKAWILHLSSDSDDGGDSA